MQISMSRNLKLVVKDTPGYSKLVFCFQTTENTSINLNFKHENY